MAYFISDLTSLLIDVSEDNDDSNAIGSVEDSECICIFAPSALTGTINVQVEPTAAGTAWRNLQSGGSDVLVPVNGAVVITEVAFRQLRLHSSAAEAADRTFACIKQFKTR